MFPDNTLISPASEFDAEVRPVSAGSLYGRRVLLFNLCIGLGFGLMGFRVWWFWGLGFGGLGV